MQTHSSLGGDMQKRLCVWNLSPETTPEDLYSLFGQVTRVISVDIPSVPANADRSMQVGFVEIETADLPHVIQKFLITELDGRTLEISESLPNHVVGGRIEANA